MADKITFYTNPMSRGRIARWALEEVGATYDTEVLEYDTTMKTPEYLAINPMGKVPAIKHGDAVVTECAAICAYLADAFHNAGLAPTPAERAAYYRWLFFFAGPVEAAITNKTLGVAVEPELERSAGYGNFDRVMSTIEQHLGATTYVAGDRFTAADIYCGSQIGWGIQFGTIQSTPVLEAYWARLTEREAYQRAGALDDQLLA